MPSTFRRSDEKRLLKLFDGLDPGQREQLMAFAEFLASRTPPAVAGEIPEPRPIPRPADESVVGAIKRLNASYFMLDEKSGLLDESSVLMTQHLMQGRDLAEVVDELEALFARHYRAWLAERQG